MLGSTVWSCVHNLIHFVKCNITLIYLRAQHLGATWGLWHYLWYHAVISLTSLLVSTQVRLIYSHVWREKRFTVTATDKLVLTLSSCCQQAGPYRHPLTKTQCQVKHLGNTPQIHRHTNTYVLKKKQKQNIYIFMYVCIWTYVCVCVCVCVYTAPSTVHIHKLHTEWLEWYSICCSTTETWYERGKVHCSQCKGSP